MKRTYQVPLAEIVFSAIGKITAAVAVAFLITGCRL